MISGTSAHALPQEIWNTIFSAKPSGARQEPIIATKTVAAFAMIGRLGRDAAYVSPRLNDEWNAAKELHLQTLMHAARELESGPEKPIMSYPLSESTMHSLNEINNAEFRLSPVAVDSVRRLVNSPQGTLLQLRAMELQIMQKALWDFTHADPKNLECFCGEALADLRNLAER